MNVLIKREREREREREAEIQTDREGKQREKGVEKEQTVLLLSFILLVHLVKIKTYSKSL